MGEDDDVVVAERTMTRDWTEWHRQYDDPESSLSRRLLAVQGCIRKALRLLSVGDGCAGEVDVISMCAGDGRDLLPVLGDDDNDGLVVRALLVELDSGLAAAARRRAHQLDLRGVHVLCGDAGTTDAFAGFAPDSLVLACGVFGNITADAGRRTVSALRGLTSPGGYVVWTRGAGLGSDLGLQVRDWFAAEGFTEDVFMAPPEETYRVGVNQLSPTYAQPFRPGVRMFAFISA